MPPTCTAENEMWDVSPKEYRSEMRNLCNFKRSKKAKTKQKK